MDNYEIYKQIQLGPRGSSYGTQSELCIAVRSNYCHNNFGGHPKDVKILDVGCGDGVMMNWFKQNGFTNVTGCDLDINKVKFTAEMTGYKTCYADLHFLSDSFTDETFDIIIASHCLEHCCYPDKVVKHCYNLLNDDGEFFVTLPYPEDFDPDNISHVSNITLGMNIKDSGITVSNFFTRDGLFELVNKHVSEVAQSEIWLTLKKI